MILILGQGLAGTTLAHTLLERGCEIAIADKGHISCSSMVAAGLWNPIVFRRINKGWMADEFSQTLAAFYPQIEKKLGAHFYHPLEVVRVHSSALESQLWEEKMRQREFSRYLGSVAEISHIPFAGKPLYGAAEVHHTGYLDLPEYLRVSRDYFRAESMLIEEDIALPYDFKDLTDWKYNGIKPDLIIDCRGSSSALHPLFSWLPFGLTKGEVLTITIPELKLYRILNAGFFLLPLGNSSFRLGATFNWNERNDKPTEAGKSELLGKLKKLLSVDYKVTDHRAGVRPTVQDRRPLLGRHPFAERLCIFNGLGTKGVFLAPWLASHFADFLLNQNPLLPEADIDRFRHLFGTTNPKINFPVG